MNRNRNRAAVWGLSHEHAAIAGAATTLLLTDAGLIEAPRLREPFVQGHRDGYEEDRSPMFLPEGPVIISSGGNTQTFRGYRLREGWPPVLDLYRSTPD
jgi:hypothetical protein